MTAQTGRKGKAPKRRSETTPRIGLDWTVMRSLLDGLLRWMQGGVFTVDPEGRITSFNKAAVWITGYCLEDVFGKPWKELFCAGSPPLERALSKGQVVYNRNAAMCGKDGNVVPVNVTVFPLKDTAGLAKGAVTIFRDVTEIKALQNQLLQSEKLAIMGRLAAGVAHEINNPISGILTYIKLLLKKLDKGDLLSSDGSELSKYLHIVERETDRCGKIVQNLLDFSRRTEPQIRLIDISSVLEQSLLLLKDQLRTGNVAVHKQLKSPLPKVMADFGQLQQVFMNLMLNAIQAMPKGGKLALKARAEGTPGRECFLIAEVSDTGCGISKEDIPKIFDPFFSSRGGGEGAGLGLGLSIVQRIVRDYHGQIGVRSRLGKGTTFTIKLPAE